MTAKYRHNDPQEGRSLAQKAASASDILTPSPRSISYPAYRTRGVAVIAFLNGYLTDVMSYSKSISRPRDGSVPERFPSIVGRG